MKDRTLLQTGTINILLFTIYQLLVYLSDSLLPPSSGSEVWVVTKLFFDVCFEDFICLMKVFTSELMRLLISASRSVGLSLSGLTMLSLAHEMARSFCVGARNFHVVMM